ncbi:MAG: type II secretion system protein GspF [Bdellovibrio sp.]|nr:MAG: type II secretion system protein GspF [Bdellovibrio sp.]
MPLFEYRGLTKAGKNVRGTIDIENARMAKLKLKKEGIYVIDLKDKSKAVKKKRGQRTKRVSSIPIKDLSNMTRQLATLLKAGIPLVDALSAVSEQTENESLSNIMAEVKNMVNEGAPLHRSLAKYPKAFDNIYVSMVEAGEMSGTLDVILLRLAEFKEAQNELSTKIRSAMIYPSLMFVFTGLILMGLFTFVIPKISQLFEESPDISLPWYSEVIFDLSGFLVDYWWALILIIFGLFTGFKVWKDSESGKPVWDAILLKLPIIGKLARMIAVSRFTRTLSTLLNGGVPMLTAMSIVRNVTNNEVLGKAIDEARENISEGESIAGPLKKSGEFPPLVIHMINIGEKTGELETMLNQVSDSYDFQVKSEVEGLTALLEPVMLIVMGGVIALIIFAVMIPMMDLMDIA